MFDNYQTALSTNASVNMYEGGVFNYCLGPNASCGYTIGGTNGVVGNKWAFFDSYSNYNKPHSFVFNTTAAIPTTTITLKSCWSNQVYNTFVWSASGVSSNTVTLPATTNIGKASYSITPAVPANALTDFHNGACKIRPSLLNIGTYTVTYNFSDTVCAGTSTNYVFNVTQPNVNWNALPSLCVGGACVSLTNQLTTLSEPGGIWSGTGVSSNLYCPSVIGTNTVTYTAGTGTCSASKAHSVTVNALPVVNVNSPVICQGSFATLTASGANTYSWNTGATGASISLSPAVTTIYTVTGISSSNCSSQKTSTITVNPIPNLTVNAPAICIGVTATLTANGALTYTWNTGGIGGTIITTPSATTNYTVTGANANNCYNTVTTIVTVNPLPNIVVNSDTLCLGDSTILNAHGAITYTWSPSSHLNNANSSSVVANPTTTIVYNVIGTDTNACKNYTTSTVTVLDSNSTYCKRVISTVINVNNAFSPNGDGLNETFIIDNIEEYPKNHVYIYNRWGQLLWNKTNYDNSHTVWDGKTQEGVALYSGTYFYIIEVEGQAKLKGWVELTK